MFRHNIRTLNEIIFQNNSKNYSVAAAFVVIVIGLTALAGWRYNIEILRRPIPGLMAMNPVTAVSIFLAGTSLFLINTFFANRLAKIIAKSLAFLVVIIGLLKIIGIVTGFDAGVDTWMFSRKIDEELAQNLPNGMAPNSAF